MDDRVWQGPWKRITSLPIQAYEVLKGAIGRALLDTYVALLNGVIDQLWNSEKVVLFCPVI